MHANLQNKDAVETLQGCWGERFILDNSCTALDSEKYTVDLGCVHAKSLSRV